MTKVRIVIQKIDGRCCIIIDHPYTNSPFKDKGFGFIQRVNKQRYKWLKDRRIFERKPINPGIFK